MWEDILKRRPLNINLPHKEKFIDALLELDMIARDIKILEIYIDEVIAHYSHKKYPFKKGFFEVREIPTYKEQAQTLLNRKNITTDIGINGYLNFLQKTVIDLENKLNASNLEDKEDIKQAYYHVSRFRIYLSDFKTKNEKIIAMYGRQRGY